MFDSCSKGTSNPIFLTPKFGFWKHRQKYQGEVRLWERPSNSTLKLKGKGDFFSSKIWEYSSINGRIFDSLAPPPGEFCYLKF